jgi:hypothetical protein
LAASARQQQSAMPLIGFVWSGGPDADARCLTAFGQGPDRYVEIIWEHRMSNILSSLFWFSSTAVGFLASADLLLLDRQKKWINDRATDFWNWLDDQRELKYLLYLRNFRWQRFVVVLYALVALIAAAVVAFLIYVGAFDEPLVPRNLPYFLLGAYTASFLAALFMVRTVLPRVLNWVTKTEGSWAYIGRSTVVAVAAIASYFATEGTDRLWMSNPIVDALNVVDPFNTQEFVVKASFSHPITAAIFGAYISLVVTGVFVMLMSWALVVLPVIVVVLLMIMFRVVQFVALRVAENPKAPQYALSALLAAGGAALGRFM